VIGITFLAIVSAEENSNIPQWIRNNAKWWGEGQISDTDFVSGMQYLIENKIMKVSDQSSVSEVYIEKYKEWAKREISKYKDYSEKLKTDIDELEDYKRNSFNRINNLEIEIFTLEKDFDDLENNYNVLLKEYTSKVKELGTMAKSTEEFAKEVEEYLETELSKPKTTIVDQKINWDMSDSKGNLYSWSMPIESYEDLVRRGEPQDMLRLEITETGEVITVRDHTKFVRSGFTKVIDQVYDNAKSNSDFVYEVWYIVSQLTTYSYDIGEDPRWALETLSRGGGDCEDTAILIAEMIKSSKHTTNWKIELVYFDADNPHKPKTMNHVAINIDDGKNNWLIESTAKNDPYAWPDGVRGWNVEV